MINFFSNLTFGMYLSQIKTDGTLLIKKAGLEIINYGSSKIITIPDSNWASILHLIPDSCYAFDILLVDNFNNYIDEKMAWISGTFYEAGLKDSDGLSLGQQLQLDDYFITEILKIKLPYSCMIRHYKNYIQVKLLRI